jgi:hypothetical protein
VTPFEEEEESWPNEPAEFDPDSLGPDVPGVSRTDELVRAGNQAPKEVQNAFWAAVLFANVGVMGVSLGAMLLYFRGDLRFGGGAFVVGVVGLAMTYRRYRAFMNRDDDDRTDDTVDPVDAPTTPAGGESARED